MRHLYSNPSSNLLLQVKLYLDEDWFKPESRFPAMTETGGMDNVSANLGDKHIKPSITWQEITTGLAQFNHFVTCHNYTVKKSGQSTWERII